MNTPETSAPLELQDLATTAALSSAVQAPPTTTDASTYGVGTVSAASEVVPEELQEQDDEDGEEGDDPVTDARRNWSHDVTLALVRIWKRVCEAHPHAGRVARMDLVYDEFKGTFDCSHRSRKAVEDKLYSVKQMYQFIVKTSGSFHKPHASLNGVVAGNRSIPAWFELTKDERRVVRSLHRVRIPNISFQVFSVLDSVLNPSALAITKSDVGVLSVPQVPSSRAADVPVSATSSPSEAAPSGHDNTDIVDNKRNWSHEVTLQLARAWHSAVRDQRDLRGAMLSQRVYNEFLRVVGNCSRSRKAIEDKMHSMKEMYRFIRLYNAGSVTRSAKTLWFDLSKPERRQIRNAHKIRVPNLPSEVYAELDKFMSQNVDAVENIPVGISQLIAAQQNLPMAAPCAPLSSPATTTTAGKPSSRGPPPTGSSALGAALTSTYEVMRRLADEENQLIPPSPAWPPSGHSNVSGSATATEVASTVEPLESTRRASEPPAKRQRQSSPRGEPVREPQLQELLTLQHQAIAERRQQHAEQMALLQEIASMLRQQPRAA